MPDMIDNKTRTLTRDEYRNFQTFISSQPNQFGYMVEHIDDFFKISFLKDVSFCWDEFFKYNDENVRGVS